MLVPVLQGRACVKLAHNIPPLCFHVRREGFEPPNPKDEFYRLAALATCIPTHDERFSEVTLRTGTLQISLPDERVTYGSRTRLAGFTVLRLPSTAKATMRVQCQLHYLAGRC
jgi:hypothetical protein